MNGKLGDETQAAGDSQPNGGDGVASEGGDVASMNDDGRDDAAPLVNATASITASVSMGQAVSITVTLAEARPSDTHVTWMLTAVSREYQALAAFPGRAVAQELVIAAGETTRSVALDTGTRGISEAIDLELTTESRDVVIEEPSLTSRITPRPTDLRQIARSLDWCFNVLHDGTVRQRRENDSFDALDATALVWADVPPIAQVSNGGQSNILALTQGGTLLRVSLEYGTPEGKILDVNTIADYDGAAIAELWAGYGHGAAVRFADGSIGFVHFSDGAWRVTRLGAGVSAHAEGEFVALVLQDGTIKTDTNFNGALATMTTLTNVVAAAATHSGVFVLMSNGSLTGYINASTVVAPVTFDFTVPNASRVVKLLASHKRLWAVYGDGAITRMGCDPYAADATLAADSSDAFSSPPLQLAAAATTLCGLLPGNLVECL